mgnify:CR=1 FL=1
MPVGLFVFNKQGTISDEADDQYKKLSIIDEYGKVITNTVYSIAEDLDGEIWVGTDQGIVIYSDTENVFEDEPQTSPIMDSAEVVSINDVEGKLVTIYDDYKMLQWEIGNIQLTLSGSLDKEELIQIAESMQ